MVADIVNGWCIQKVAYICINRSSGWIDSTADDFAKRCKSGNSGSRCKDYGANLAVIFYPV